MAGGASELAAPAITMMMLTTRSWIKQDHTETERNEKKINKVGAVIKSVSDISWVELNEFFRFGSESSLRRRAIGPIVFTLSYSSLQYSLTLF